MLMYSYIAVVMMASFFNSGDAAVPSFTTPTGGTGTKSIAEGQASGTTVESFVATATGTVTFALETANVPFAITAAGVLTNTAVIDFETDTKVYTLIVVGTDPDNSDTASATLTVSITDVDENPPTFAESDYSVCAVDGSVTGTTVYTLTSTDPEGAAVTYSIHSGDTNSDFTIDTTYLKTAKVLAMGTTETYNLVIKSTDSASNEGQANFVVTVQSSCSGASALAVSLITLLMGLVYALN